MVLIRLRAAMPSTPPLKAGLTEDMPEASFGPLRCSLAHRESPVSAGASGRSCRTLPSGTRRGQGPTAVGGTAAGVPLRGTAQH